MKANIDLLSGDRSDGHIQKERPFTKGAPFHKRSALDVTTFASEDVTVLESPPAQSVPHVTTEP